MKVRIMCIATAALCVAFADNGSDSVRFVTYEQYGAVGDGKTDDRAAIVAAHNAANEKGLPVKATSGKTYLLGKGDETAIVKTDVDFGTARFVIDDVDVKNRCSPAFRVEPSRAAFEIKGVKPFKRGTKNLGVSLPFDSLVILENSKVRRYIRYGSNRNTGAPQKEVFIVRRDGSIDPRTPSVWDFDAVTKATAYPIDERILEIKGGVFTTIANRCESKYTYHDRGIVVRRSNTRVSGLRHEVTGEADHGAPYNGFLRASRCAHVALVDCVFTGHKTYRTIGSAGRPVSMGSYDVTAGEAADVSLVNCTQTTDIDDSRYWGVFASNYCKSLLFDKCVLSRFDAHMGVANATILNSRLGYQGINAIGFGTFRIENTEVRGNAFINLRSDYGSTWEGDFVVRNCRFVPRGRNGALSLISGSYSGMHDFGYVCHLPSKIVLDGLFIDDASRRGEYDGPCVFADFNKDNNSPQYVEKFPYRCEGEVELRNVSTSSGKSLSLSPNKYMFRNVRPSGMTGVGLPASSSLAEPLEWKFPLASHCHQGMAFGDAVTGVLVWGGGDTLNFTVGRSDLWDHRGGYKWTDEQSYSNIVSIARAGDKDRMVSLFRKKTPKGEPRNPTMLPLGRIVVKIQGAELKRGTLDPFTGRASLFLADGREIKLAMCRGWGGGMFAIKFPEGLEREVSFVHSMEFPNVAKRLAPLGFKPAEKKFLGSAQIGFTWELPADDPVSLGTWREGKDELCFRTTRSTTCGLGFWGGPSPNYENISRASERWWRRFWKTAARVTIPDKALQEAYDYGMYRFASMTGADGVPAGLQGPWIEDDALPPWSGDYHFNINVQECYSPAFRGGHPEHLKPLFAMIKSWWPILRSNAKKFCGIEDGFVLPHSVDDRGTNIGGFWTGTIDHGSAAWVARMMFKYVCYSRDVAFLKTDAYPFMKGAMKVYRAMMEETADGKLAIPVGPSPEFGGADFRKAIGRNPSFQLAAAHRLARDLISAAEMLGEKPDPMWLDVQKRLPLFSETKEGIALFEGRTLTESHRHHSHMAGLYPFDIIPMSTAQDLDLVGRTYGQWAKMGTGRWCGWCIPWASILHTHVGDPDMAVKRLHEWLRSYCNPGRGSMCYPNRNIMLMDGQCATVTAILEMLVHEVDGKVGYFRGCPKGWRDVRFENILLSDGTRVSGSRIDGKETITVVKLLAVP